MKTKISMTKILALTLALGLLLATGAMAADETITGTVDKDDNGIIVICIGSFAYRCIQKQIMPDEQRCRYL
ncbi:hypothetical protein [Desulfosarcina ovata]|uniref:Uncharacterized protein n=1 Tax=Desulfosarcina ovata subsp. ovata TaxID=2752305 RepID=A0A5K8A4B1_9BACT|nr:hypothetical protein [Desulfosarcina ovata]BBO87287.1 hypothetical protein DSCOOX_04670 [Desulfosarcina ovata subsp. ovata]